MLNGLANALCSFEIAAILWPMQALDDFGGQDRFDWFVTNPGKYMNFHVTDDFLRVVV
jgi:hypothetical protein